MTTSTVNEYKIYCTTESVYVSGWGIVPPTVCYNNNTHSTNINSVQIISTIESHAVSIIEDKIPISRNTRIIQIALENVAFGNTLSVDYIFPINMSMYLFDYITGDLNTLDALSIHANPDTVLGLIGADIAAGDNTFIGPPALIAYAVVGFYLTLTDGTNSNDVGIITDIDPITSIVTVRKPTTNAFLAANTIVSMTLKIFDELLIGSVGVHKYGEKIIGGAAIPKGTVTRYIYKNNAPEGPPVSLFLHLTCLY